MLLGRGVGGTSRVHMLALPDAMAQRRSGKKKAGVKSTVMLMGTWVTAERVMTGDTTCTALPVRGSSRLSTVAYHDTCNVPRAVDPVKEANWPLVLKTAVSGVVVSTTFCALSPPPSNRLASGRVLFCNTARKMLLGLPPILPPPLHPQCHAHQAP